MGTTRLSRAIWNDTRDMKQYSMFSLPVRSIVLHPDVSLNTQAP